MQYNGIAGEVSLTEIVALMRESTCFFLQFCWLNGKKTTVYGPLQRKRTKQTEREREQEEERWRKVDKAKEIERV